MAPRVCGSDSPRGCLGKEGLLPPIRLDAVPEHRARCSCTYVRTLATWPPLRHEAPWPPLRHEAHDPELCPPPTKGTKAAASTNGRAINSLRCGRRRASRRPRRRGEERASRMEMGRNAPAGAPGAVVAAASARLARPRCPASPMQQSSKAPSETAIAILLLSDIETRAPRCPVMTRVNIPIPLIPTPMRKQVHHFGRDHHRPVVAGATRIVTNLHLRFATRRTVTGDRIVILTYWGFRSRFGLAPSVVFGKCTRT